MNRPLVLPAAVFLLAVAGCTDPARYNEGSDTNRATQGAAIGAAVGAVTGLIVGDDARSAVIGAAVGAGAGAVIGNQLDKQEAELRAALDGQVRIENTGDQLIVTMPQDVLFDINSAALRPDLIDDLASLAASLQSYPETTVDVIGHTDNTGPAEFNQRLSAERANSAASVLVSNGVGPGRVRAIGRGEDAPIASNLDEAGRQMNRRVEFVIRPTA